MRKLLTMLIAFQAFLAQNALSASTDVRGVGETLEGYIAPNGLEAFKDKYESLAGSDEDKTTANIHRRKVSIFDAAVIANNFEIAEFLRSKNSKVVTHKNARGFPPFGEAIAHRSVFAMIYLIKVCGIDYKLSDITRNFERDLATKGHKYLTEQSIKKLKTLKESDRDEVVATLLLGRVPVPDVDIARELAELRAEFKQKFKIPTVIRVLMSLSSSLQFVSSF